MQIKINVGSNYKFVAGAVAIMAIALAVNWQAGNSGRAGRLLENLATPHSGEEEVLPREVQSAVKFLRSNHVKAIRLSPRISENRFIAQPLTESVYPIVVDASASILVSDTAEAMSIDCTTLTVEKGIRVADCR